MHDLQTKLQQTGMQYILRPSVLWWGKLLTFLTDNCRFKVYENCSGDMLSRTRFREESIEWIVAWPNGFVARHLAIRMYTVLKTIQLPASIAHLDSSLADVDGNAFTLRGTLILRRNSSALKELTTLVSNARSCCRFLLQTKQPQ